MSGACLPPPLSEAAATDPTAAGASSTRSGTAPTLALLSMAQFLIALDYSIIYVALPSIATDLGLEPAIAQWVLSAYAVMFAGFLVIGGRLSDRIGARRLFVVAVLIFGAASAVGGVAGSGAVLLGARGVQGFGAALLQPAVLAVIGTRFAAGPARSKALAVWGSVGTTGLATGALLGGVLTAASWRLTFFINVPLTAACALGAVLWIGSAEERIHGGRLPVLASTLGAGTVLSLVLGLTLGAELRWTSAPTVACLCLAAASFVLFVRNESRSLAVLIEPVLRGISGLRVGAAATALYMASVGSEFYLLTLVLQTLKGYTPLEAGLAFLPLAVMVTAGSAAAGLLLRSTEASTVLGWGFAVATAGLVWLALALHGDSYWVHLLPGVILSGFGHGVIYTSMFALGTQDVPAAHQGTAGALLTTSQYLVGALTLAVLTLALGSTPGAAEFRGAFLITAAASAAGLAFVSLGPCAARLLRARPKRQGQTLLASPAPSTTTTSQGKRET